MDNKSNMERGQALVLIVFAMFGIFGIVALAIDASNALSERRRAQNAADTSALAAALAKVAGQEWHNAGMDRALINGYDNNGTSNTVEVVNPPGEGCSSTGSPYIGNEEYVQVVIHTTVQTFFGPVIGIFHIHNCVEAIARAKPGVHIPLFYGNAIASTACHGDSTINAQGSSSTVTIDGGVFSNSDSSEAMTINWPDNLQTPSDLGVSSVGGIAVNHGSYPSPMTEGAEQIPCPLPDYMLPKYTCDYEYGNFPPPGVTNLSPGVYCISGEFDETDGLTGIGVTFVMLNRGFHWSGNAAMTLVAPDSGTTKGLLMYLPPSNTDGIDLTGNPYTVILGTIFAPNSDMNIRGDFGGQALRSQWIGKTVTIEGSTRLTIQFDQLANYEFPEPPSIELTK